MNSECFTSSQRLNSRRRCRPVAACRYSFYTPLCGTCKLAQKMCTVAMEALPGTTVYSCNVRRFPNQVQAWKIESVPCLVIAQGSEALHKVYAFESVDKVYHLLKDCQTL